MLNQLNVVGICAGTLPRTNLGPRWTSVNEEDRFAIAFSGAYDRQFRTIHKGTTKLNRVMAREVPVNGFGIADLVTVSWGESDLTTMRAFEFKLSDWRRGLMQAHRYRFFADVAILVVPASKLAIIDRFIRTFKALNVGLWGFDDATGIISQIFTPRPRRPPDRGHREKAVSRVLATISQGQPTP